MLIFSMRDNPIISLASVVWRLAAGARPRVVTYLAFFTLANTVVLVQPLILAHVLNQIQTIGIHRENLGSLLAFLALFLLQDFVFWMFHGPARVMEMRTAFEVRAKYKEELMSGTLDLPLSWHVDHHSGDTIDKIEKGTRGIYEFTEHGFQVVEAFVRFVGSLIAIAIFNVHSIAVVVFLFGGALWALSRFDRVLVRQYGALNRAENVIAAKVFDALSNVTTIVILRVQALFQRDLRRAIARPFALFLRNARLNEWKWFSASFGAGILQFLVLGSYAYFVLRNDTVLLVGSFFALYTYTNRINDVFFTFAYLYGDIVRWRSAVQNAEDISRAFPKPTVAPSKALPRDWQELEVHNLSFSYHETRGADLHLDRIGFRLRRGEKVAVIGESGSGKTTLLKLMRSLYEPRSGEVRLDGVVLPGGFADIGDDIALIPQDPELFTTTIRENITMGLDHSESEIARFIDLARLAAVVERLPRKLNSSIVEKGVNLSGGERQRLALARGLMAAEGKSILLLDESTSSVDAHNELLIYENIFSEYREQIIIASIHRLHLLRLFDTIYLFHDGAIEARGSFEELLRHSERFAAQWEKYTRSHGSQTKAAHHPTDTTVDFSPEKL